MAVHDLRLSLNIELAQLLTQTRDCLFHLLDVELDQVDLLAKPRMINTDFASGVQQILEKIRVDTGEFLPLFSTFCGSGFCGSGFSRDRA